MSYKTILLHLDERPRRTERLEIAVRLAETFGGQVVGAFASRSAFIPSLALADAGPEMIEVEGRTRREMVSKAEKDFVDTARRAGVRFAWRACTADGRDAGYAELLGAARYADLVVAGQPEPDDITQRGFLGELLLAAGRPVLIVPYAGRFMRIGQRVLVAWNGSREAARAVSDALPLLSSAGSVEVIEVDTNAGRRAGVEAPGGDIAAFLARHGVKATFSRERALEVGVGEEILSRAADFGSDLIVMGAYGHSRMRELILGGATRRLLDSMTVPLLMSH